MHFRPFPLLTLFALPSLILLLVLGQWQWQRFSDKKDLPPIASVQALEGADVFRALTAEADFIPAKLTGTWAQGTIAIYAVEDGQRGARWFSPLTTPEGTVLVDRGFVADGTPKRDTAGSASLDGMMRLGAKPNRYTPDNDPAKGTWYWPDVPQLTEALSITSAPATSTHYFAVATTDLMGTGKARPNPFAQPGGANLIPAERHFGYALTWWGLAAALIGVYLAFHASKGRLGRKTQ